MASFLIAAATSNSGKTTITMGLLRALRNRGLKVQPFKCGPDYIDPMFHSMASGNDSVNLDTWMTSPEQMANMFHTYAKDADVCVVEGVMGLYDGYDKWHGSSGEIAAMLDIPVILVVNAKSAAYSVAPLIYGFKNAPIIPCEDGTRKPVNIAGVIFNMVASESHFKYLKEACDDIGVPCLGYVAKNPALVVPSRHLGLTITAKEDTERLIQLAAEEVERGVNIEYLFNEERVFNEELGIRNEELLLSRPIPIPSSNNAISLDKKTNHSSFLIPNSSLKTNSSFKMVAIARDEAFNFIYRNNIDVLRSMGEVRFFSPLRDKELPECDLLYLPGGYPELFADDLVKNEQMRQSIRRFAEKGGHIYAECGGFMYLCNRIDDAPMCGVFPFIATMEGAHLHLGYRLMERDGAVIKGHEFHYSCIKPIAEMPDSITVERCQRSAKGTPVDTAIYHYKNVTAGYTHWYF